MIPIEVVAGKLFQNITDGLQDTLKLLNFDDVHKAVLLLRAAKRIAAYGFGNSATVCRDIETRFLRFGIPVQGVFGFPSAGYVRVPFDAGRCRDCGVPYRGNLGIAAVG